MFCLAVSFDQVAELAVAVGTLVLAGATWWMARSTRGVAQKTGRQAEATERLVELTAEQLGVDLKQLEAGTDPYLQVRRHDDGSAWVEWSGTTSAFTVQIENPSDARCVIRDESLIIDGAGSHGQWGPQARESSLEPGQPTLRMFSVGDAAGELALSGRAVRLTVSYSRPRGGELCAFHAELKAKDRGQRWLIVSEENR